MSENDFQESHWRSAPIRDLGLSITGTHLEPLVARLMAEAERAGIRRLKPRAVMVELTTLVTALAMNHVHFGTYLP